MRIVIDTNVAISGLLWGGPPNHILKLAKQDVLTILICEETANELKQVLQNDKFTKRLSMLDTNPNEVFSYFMNLARHVPGPEIITDIITEDPFDNVFLSLAEENKASLIASGDKHLIDVIEFKGIQIVTPSEATNIIDEIRFQ